MAPRRQPSTLLRLAVRSSISLINEACCAIEKCNPESECPEYEEGVFILKQYLRWTLPARLFDMLCAERTCFQLRADPRIQLSVLMHPNMSEFRKCDLDNSIPHYFWMDVLPGFTHLKALDLKFICTDEIIQIVCNNCPILEEINVVSRVDIRKSLINASMLVRNVSDSGLECLAELRRLKVLAMDAPRNERAKRCGRFVSQDGIRKLVSRLPQLEELRIESCDIGATLVGADYDMGPLNLKKINCHFASAERMQKLINLCPALTEFSVIHLSEVDKDEILEQITSSELRLNKLDFSFFSFNYSMKELLREKGRNITHFSLWEVENSITLDAVVAIGEHCPHIKVLQLVTHSKCLIVPNNFRTRVKMFTRLESLSLGCDNFNIENLVMFFVKCTSVLQKLMLKYQTKTVMDGTLLRLLQTGCLSQLKFLWLDCTLVVSKSVVREIMQACELLTVFVVDFVEDMSDLQCYIRENNLDLKLLCNY